VTNWRAWGLVKKNLPYFGFGNLTTLARASGTVSLSMLSAFTVCLHKIGNIFRALTVDSSDDTVIPC